MRCSMIMGPIKKHFHYLFEDYDFTVFSETYFESFGNWVVVLLSDDFRIRLFEDRGDVTLAVGPLWSPPGWQGGPWHDLTRITAFLTQGKDIWEYKRGTTDEQLQRLAGILRPYCDQIRELLQEEVYQQNKEKLRRVGEQLRDQLWDQLTGKT